MSKTQYMFFLPFHLQFLSEDFQPRTTLTHAHHCSQLDGPLHDHITTTYGIQRLSILNTSKYFNVVEGLTPDIMHDILEGCLMYETKELLKYLILDRKIFTLDELNNRIESFPYCHSDAIDKPVAIKTLTTTDHKIKQSGKSV